MKEIINILHLEDNSLDVELIHSILRKELKNCNIDTVLNRKDYETKLKRNKYDLILADYDLPAFDGLSALKILKTIEAKIPFIFVTGKISEDAAIDAMKEGATDYVFKDKLKKLIPAIQKAFNTREKKGTSEDIQKSLSSKGYIIETSISAIATANPDGSITYVNQSFNKLWSYPKNNEIIDKPITALWQFEDKAATFVNYLTKNNACQKEFLAKKKDDTFFVAHVIATIVKNNKEKPICIMASFADILKKNTTEKQNSKNRNKYKIKATEINECKKKLLDKKEMLKTLENITDNLPLMVSAFDCNGKFVLWNKKSEKVTGFTKNDIIGKRLNEIINLTYLDKEPINNIREKLEDSTLSDCKINIRCRDGKCKIVSLMDISRHINIPGIDKWTIGIDTNERN